MACFAEFSYLSSVLSSSVYDLRPLKEYLNSVSALLLQNYVSADVEIAVGCAVLDGAGVYLGFCVLDQDPQVYVYM
jgi:hypothetical protein